ncbi:cilia- and flagella-associated protein 299 isoform X1 [Amia ocellicauda]|uniref:cilia- and flagella-associated protein 299 isoform X1 n=1 Tax=Amia ocellicauda TaxID=2972642 RepID=UPI0034641C7E
MAEQDGALPGPVSDFNTYQDFLDSQITPLDLYYLEDEELARQLVELGYRGSGEVLKREEFETRKAAAEASRLSKRSQQKTLASAGKEFKDNFLKALAEREEANRSGKMTSIIFLRDRNSHGQEISGYIDYSHRLKTEEFEPYFSGKKRLLPRPTDLSNSDPSACFCYYTLLFLNLCQYNFYNWETQVSTSNPSPNYQVIAENSSGLLFKNKRDRKILNVDPKLSPGDNSARTPVQSELYTHVVIYDHVTRRKT